MPVWACLFAAPNVRKCKITAAFGRKNEPWGPLLPSVAKVDDTEPGDVINVCALVSLGVPLLTQRDEVFEKPIIDAIRLKPPGRYF